MWVVLRVEPYCGTARKEETTVESVWVILRVEPYCGFVSFTAKQGDRAAGAEIFNISFGRNLFFDCVVFLYTVVVLQRRVRSILRENNSAKRVGVWGRRHRPVFFEAPLFGAREAFSHVVFVHAGSNPGVFEWFRNPRLFVVVLILPNILSGLSGGGLGLTCPPYRTAVAVVTTGGLVSIMLITAKYIRQVERCRKLVKLLQFPYSCTFFAPGHQQGCQFLAPPIPGLCSADFAGRQSGA